MRKVYIVGAGPVGLLTAIQFKKLGIDAVLIDPRADEYIRPGVLNDDVFEALSQAVGEKIKKSTSRHIKDAERSLYEIAQKLNIEIKKASFIGFDNNAIRIQYSENGSIETLPCDVAIDATGSSRVLVNAVNQLSANTFHIKPIDNVNIKNHLLAYVKMSEADRTVLKILRMGAVMQNDISKVNTLEELRAMGWEGFAEPLLEFQIFEKNKVCLYTELPPKLGEAQREEWLQKVLKLHTGKIDIAFQKIPSASESKQKIRFNAFPVDPQKVDESYYQNEKWPCVIPLGDARTDPQFLIGIGIKNGIEQMKALISAIKLDESSKEFTIDLEKYSNVSKNVQISYVKLIKQFYQARRNKTESVIAEQLRNYTAAVADAEDPSLMKSYQELYALCDQRADDLCKQAIAKFQSALNPEGSIRLDKYSMVENEKIIDGSIDLLNQALLFAPDSSKVLPTILQTFETIAVKYKELGLYYFNQASYGNSLNYYKKAKNIFETFSNSSKQEVILEIKLDIARLLCKTNTYMEAYSLMKEIEKEMQTVVMPDKEKFLAQVHYAKVLVQFNLIVTGVVAQTNQKLIEACQKDFLSLKANKYLTPKDLTVLEQLLGLIKLKQPEQSPPIKTNLQK